MRRLKVDHLASTNPADSNLNRHRQKPRRSMETRNLSLRVFELAPRSPLLSKEWNFLLVISTFKFELASVSKSVCGPRDSREIETCRRDKHKHFVNISWKHKDQSPVGSLNVSFCAAIVPCTRPGPDENAQTYRVKHSETYSYRGNALVIARLAARGLTGNPAYSQKQKIYCYPDVTKRAETRIRTGGPR
jgi:hypothetical protein